MDSPYKALLFNIDYLNLDRFRHYDSTIDPFSMCMTRKTGVYAFYFSQFHTAALDYDNTIYYGCLDSFLI